MLRELAIEQITAHVEDLQRRLMPTVEAVATGGDFKRYIVHSDEKLTVAQWRQ
jgi:hypothetical protein